MTKPEQKALEYGKTSIDYHLSYADRETLAIHVHPDLHVTVEAPLDSDFSEIEKRLRKRASWILRQQQNFRRYSFDIPPRKHVSGETHRYLGRQYQLKVLQSENEKEYVKMDREHILVGVRDKSNREQVRKRLTNWYRQRAYEIFCERVNVWFPRFERYGIRHPEVAVRQMHAQWGSCSVRGKMNLNLKLVMVPRQFIDYVIVHELCHLIEHNHSSSFYALMSKIMPDWEEKRESLNKFEF
jgi:predicted metal-dependent hydrolase